MLDRILLIIGWVGVLFIALIPLILAINLDNNNYLWLFPLSIPMAFITGIGVYILESLNDGIF